MNMRIIPIYGEGVVCQFASVYDATKRKNKSRLFRPHKKRVLNLYFIFLCILLICILGVAASAAVVAACTVADGTCTVADGTLPEF